MEKRVIAGRSVFPVGLGCMSFGGIYGSTNEEESVACLKAAIDTGIDHLDVAEIYGAGRSEEIMGRFLAAEKPDVSIATKAGIYQSPTRHFSNAPDRLRASLEGSLKRLGRDHVDLFYIHRREAERPIETVIETLIGFIDEGLIGAIGLSEIAPSTLRRAHAVHPVAAVQNEYSLWSRQPELGMLQACAELGVAFVAFSPLARGMLTDALPDPTAFLNGDFRTPMPRFTEPNYSANCAAIASFQEFCAARGWKTAAAALAWTLDQAPHIVPIPGTRTAENVRICASAAEITFTEDDRAEIARLLPPGFAHGDRYADSQMPGIERYC